MERHRLRYGMKRRKIFLVVISRFPLYVFLIMNMNCFYNNNKYSVFQKKKKEKEREKEQRERRGERQMKEKEVSSVK